MKEGYWWKKRVIGSVASQVGSSLWVWGTRGLLLERVGKIGDGGEVVQGRMEERRLAVPVLGRVGFGWVVVGEAEGLVGRLGVVVKRRRRERREFQWVAVGRGRMMAEERARERVGIVSAN